MIKNKNPLYLYYIIGLYYVKCPHYHGPEETTTSEPDSLTEPTTDAAATSEQRANLEETPATDAAFWHYAVSPLLLIAVAMLI
ncbi:unnamed protein product [Plutella xylostella]|uniref:(diamondback moth) hypothetical protein n=1 Tax=Plutella xylostella TaxID=51655 RepID=A0A8S4G632_PLUXY|nr:unnamed protein product [Plutella xylostella]